MAEIKTGRYAGYIKFSGTKAQFIEKGYNETYVDKIVLISGSEGKGSCIFTRGMYFANFDELIAAVNYVKGVKVGNNSYNAAAGGGYVEFTGATNNTVTLDVANGKITIGLTDAFIKRVSDVETEITNIKNNYATTTAMNTAIGDAKTELKGTSSDASTVETIYGAKKYAEEKASAAETAAKSHADTKKSEVIGASGDASTADTIYGAKAFAQEKANGVATTLIGVTTDGTDKSTIFGAKNFATSKANTAETNAKSYADTKKSEVIGSASDKSTDNTIYGVKAYTDAKVAEVNGVASGIDTRLQAVEGDVTTIKGDYLKSTDKTELGNRITNEAPVTIEEAAGSGDILKSYTFTQNGKTIGTINLAKELVVTGGEIVEIDGVKNLQLTIANQTAPVNIPVTDLVDVYTAKANATQVQVAISNTNEISASVVAKSITATELNDNAVETAKIKDGNVTKAKLESGVQTSLSKADSAYQKPSAGIPKTDLVEGVQTSLSKADSAYQKPSAGIPAADLATNSVVTAKIADENVTKAKLEADVQASLDKADSAIQSINTGSANGTISVDGSDVVVKGLGSAAYTASTAYATSTQGGYADSALQTIGAGDYITVADKTGNNGAKTQTVTAKVVTIESATALKQGFADAFDAKRQIEGAVSTAKAYADSRWEWLDLD